MKKIFADIAFLFWFGFMHTWNYIWKCTTNIELFRMFRRSEHRKHFSTIAMHGPSECIELIIYFQYSRAHKAAVWINKKLNNFVPSPMSSRTSHLVCFVRVILRNVPIINWKKSENKKRISIDSSEKQCLWINLIFFSHPKMVQRILSGDTVINVIWSSVCLPFSALGS